MSKLVNHTQIDSIQLLRAVAALAVVLSHTPVTKIGVWGVDVFFVISGFIIAFVTAHSADNFILKRLIRIVPLYWLGTLGIFAIGLLLPQLIATPDATVWDLLKSMFFIPFERGHGTFPLLFLGWTLNLEMFFYAVFALSMLISHRYRIIICSAILIALWFCKPYFRGYLIPSFFAKPIIMEFVFGMACYALFSMWQQFKPQNWQRILLAIVVIAGFIWMLNTPHFLGMGTRWWRWGIPAAMVFLAIVTLCQGLSLPKPLLRVGDASYSLYLFHPYIIQALAKPLDMAQASFSMQLLFSLLMMVVCTLISVQIFTYIESPMTQALRKRLLKKPD